jgi:hypothetical protein
MPALKLLGKLAAYYLAIVVVVTAVFMLFPAMREFMPVGRVQGLIDQAGGGLKKSDAPAEAAAHVRSLGASLGWLCTATLGALLTALPTSWVYMDVRNSDDYDQSLVDTIVILPIVVTGIVVIVQNSLALSFSLAGIAGAARFRNTLKSSGDLLFILMAIAIGLSAGIGAVELAFVMSVAFNLCFVLLWSGRYGERKGMKRFLNDLPEDHHRRTTTSVDVTTVTVSSVSEPEKA